MLRLHLSDQQVYCLLRWTYIRGLTGSFIVPANGFRRGHRIDEHALVSSCVHPWFLTFRQLSGKLITFTPKFKLYVCICLVSVQNEFAFGLRQPNFGLLIAK